MIYWTALKWHSSVFELTKDIPYFALTFEILVCLVNILEEINSVTMTFVISHLIQVCLGRWCTPSTFRTSTATLTSRNGTRSSNDLECWIWWRWTPPRWKSRRPIWWGNHWEGCSANSPVKLDKWFTHYTTKLLVSLSMSQLTVQQSYLLCWELLPDRNRISMGLWYWELMSHPDPAVLPVGTLHSLEWFWVSRRIFIYSHHNASVFSLRRPSVPHPMSALWRLHFWLDPFNIYTSYQATSKGVSHIKFLAKFQDLNFWQLF